MKNKFCLLLSLITDSPDTVPNTFTQIPQTSIITTHTTSNTEDSLATPQSQDFPTYDARDYDVPPAYEVIVIDPPTYEEFIKDNSTR